MKVLLDAQNRRYIVASPAKVKPDIDGSLEDDAWLEAVFQGNFLQRDPREGEDATERTELGLLYDERNLYIGVRCFDQEPEQIIAREMRRDARVDDDDYVEIVLDTYHDHRSGFYFIFNPYGSKRDAVLANEGQSFNSSWDGIWHCRTRIDSEGWTAELAIPWKTLRFSEQDSSVWGINVGRMIRRKNESVYWQLIPRDLGHAGVFRLSHAGNLHGLRNLRMGGNLELKPYLVSGLERDDPTGYATQGQLDVGLDSKVAVTANMALDLTVNPDFAQVESDREQVNLSRFSLYYPEKREFFLEGAEIFEFGSRRRRYGGRSSAMSLFYSRRIGLVEEEEARILGGAKLVGKVGDYHIGFMNMVTDRVVQEDGTPVSRANFSVIRMRRDIMQRGSLGLMYLGREDLGSAGFNRSFGADCFLPFSDYFDISGYLAASMDSELEGGLLGGGRNMAGSLRLNYNSDLWQFSLSGTDIGADFNPEMGYVRRVDYRLTSGSISYSPRPGNDRVIRQFSYEVDGLYRTDHANRMLDSEVGVDFDIHFQNSARISLGVERSREFVDEDWEVREGYPVPMGTYEETQFSSRLRSDPSLPLAGELDLRLGDYYTGNNVRIGIQGSVTTIPRLRMELDYRWNRISMPQGRFQTHTLGIRTYYYFSTQLYFKAYLQINDDRLEYQGREKVVGNFLLRWIFSPGSNFYLVYNDIRLAGPGRDEIQNRTFMLKTTFFWRK
jgi:hypothetical protein